MLTGTAALTFHDGVHHTLSAGDLAIFPRGAAHIVAAEHRTTAPFISDLVPHRPPGASSALTLGDPAAARIGRMLCAGLDYDSTAELLLYQLLPDVLVVRAEQITTQPLLTHLLLGILTETDVPGDGTEAVRLRAFELAYLLGLRLALTTSTDTRLGRALQHPRLGPALVAINTDYHHPWTVPSLAELTDMAQSTFCREFTAAVGTTPGVYLRTRRLLEAKRLLAETSDPLETIARAVGYGSTIGLHQAFTREVGHTPGAYREQQRHPHAN
jgi:AraC family transcriptional regulator, activator of mtrCDE